MAESAKIVKSNAELKRHPLAIAWDEWLASAEGQECRQANTLAHNTNVYLENRLHRSFDAGASTAESNLAREVLADVRSNMPLRERDADFITARLLELFTRLSVKIEEG